jgi:hypothetical protein
MAVEKAEFAKQKSMGKLDFGSQPLASKRDNLLDLSEFGLFLKSGCKVRPTSGQIRGEQLQ